MRVLLTLVFLAFALPAAANCDGPDFGARLTPDDIAALDARVAAMPFATGLRFQATRAGKSVTLVGTIHIHDDALADMRDRLRGAVADADVLLVEATDADATAMQAHLAANPEMIFLTDGPTLPELLDEPTWQMLAEAAKARQIPPFMVAKMQPWFLALQLAVPPCAMTDMLAGRQGLDFMLMEEAEAAGVPVRALEHWSVVIDMMRADTLEDQLAELSVGLMPVDMQTELFVAMMRNYLNGDVARVWEMSRTALALVPGLDPVAATKAFDEAEEKLLFQRNRNWLPVITEVMASADTAVVAVGAAHLPGDAGLLQLLQQAGWQITQLD